jgi:hypothetical protein
MGKSSTSAKPGQATPGAGRPKGSKDVFSKESTRKLIELGHDPIEKMIELMGEIDQYIQELKLRPRPPNDTIATLYNAKQRINADLLRYRYGRVPEVDPNEGKEQNPFVVKLTK